MNFNGIDQITYGVDDLAEAKRFFSDWGLQCSAESADQAILETLNGAQVVLKSQNDPALPTAFETGPTLREAIWGVADEATQQALNQKLNISSDADGVSRCVDPNGLTIGYRISQRRALNVQGAAMNTIDKPARIDQPAPVYQRAEPVNIGHIVLFTDKLDEMEQFYRENFAFQLSDRYPGRGVFLRCQPEGGHHNLFLLQLPTGKVGLNHVAFTVRDIHEVFGGGIHVSRCGWQTEIGPGRHPISSAYFWYVKNPCGGTVEYYADEDYLTANWQPREFQPSTENFAEWAISGGIDPETRRQRQN